MTYLIQHVLNITSTHSRWINHVLWCKIDVWCVRCFYTRGMANTSRIIIVNNNSSSISVTIIITNITIFFTYNNITIISPIALSYVTRVIIVFIMCIALINCHRITYYLFCKLVIILYMVGFLICMMFVRIIYYASTIFVMLWLL